MSYFFLHLILNAGAYAACLYYVVPIGTCKKRNPHFSLLPQPYTLFPKL